MTSSWEPQESRENPSFPVLGVSNKNTPSLNWGSSIAPRYIRPKHYHALQHALSDWDLRVSREYYLYMPNAREYTEFRNSVLF